MIPSVSPLLVIGSFYWFLASGLWIYPHSLSYFNESVGGPLNGPQHLLGSNLDWGQDLMYLAQWLNRHDSLRNGKLFLGYFGGFDPADVGFCNAHPLSELTEIGRRERIDYSSSKDTKCKYQRIVASVELLCGGAHPARDGCRNIGPISFERAPFKDIGRFEMAGYSICIINDMPERATQAVQKLP